MIVCWEGGKGNLILKIIKETQIELTNFLFCSTKLRVCVKLAGLLIPHLATLLRFDGGFAQWRLHRGIGHTQIMIGYREDSKKEGHEPLHTEKIFADRKIFFLDLKENDRGKFVKITEDVRGRRDTIMVPAEVLDDFVEALQNVQQIAHGSE